MFKKINHLLHNHLIWRDKENLFISSTLGLRCQFYCSVACILMRFNSRPQLPARKNSLPERLYFRFSLHFVYIHCSWNGIQLDFTKTGQMFEFRAWGAWQKPHSKGLRPNLSVTPWLKSGGFIAKGFLWLHHHLTLKSQYWQFSCSR